MEICEQERIVHRDIKPENIFVKKGTFKLGDFGISRELSDSASRSLRKRAGSDIYISPEAFNISSKVDNRTDIYSLGITMYRYLNNGMPPFLENIDYDAIEDAIGTRLSGKAIPIPKKDNGQLWKIVQKACQFNRENRYQHASEMRRDLEKLRDEEKKLEKKVKLEKSDFQKLGNLGATIESDVSLWDMELDKGATREEKKIEQDKEEIQTGLELDQLMKELSQMKEEVEELKRKRKERYEF